MINVGEQILEIIFSHETELNIIVGYLAVISAIGSIGTIIAAKAFYVYRVKRLSTFKRPVWLTEEESDFLVKYYVKTKVRDNNKTYTFDKFIKKVLVKSKKQYHLVLGESGSGKSSFLVNLYYRYQCRLFKRGYQINYLPLRLPNILEEIAKIDEKKGTILLLDAFDEADSANIDANMFFSQIEECTKSFAKVIISSRNNFFDSDEVLPSKVQTISFLLLEQKEINKYYICPFSKRDIISYIVKKYKLSFIKEVKAFRVIGTCTEVVSRPLILSYIDLLIQVPRAYKNLSEVYHSIVSTWVQREAQYIVSVYKSEKLDDVQRKMQDLINEIAIYMYNNFLTQKDYYIKIRELRNIPQAMRLEHMDGKRSRSLFNRVSDKLFFSHKSLLEYVLAINFDKLKFRFEPNLNVLYKFLREMNEAKPTAIYNSLFQINHTNTVSKVEDKEGNLRVYSYGVSYVNRKTVEFMAEWYCRAALLPVFFEGELYNRDNIEIQIQGKYIYKVDEKTKKYQLTENIMHHVKKCVAYRTTPNIVIVTFLSKRDG